MEATHPLATSATVTSTAAHPLVLAAAASVTVLSLTGVAYLAGWLPGPTNPGPTNPGTAERPLAAASQTTMPPIAIQQTVTLPQEKPKVAVTKQADSATPAVRRVASPAASRPVEAGAAPSIAVYPAPTPVVNTPPPITLAQAPICRECGVVEAMRTVPVEAKGGATGAVAGGVIGGYIGNQWGRGATRDIATVLGALGGAYAGNHIEKSIKEAKRYDLIVRFEDGSTRTFSSETPPAWQTGDRVKLQYGTLISGGGRSATDMGTI
jgi:outer membrane lipoprotein SlyB